MPREGIERRREEIKEVRRGEERRGELSWMYRHCQGYFSLFELMLQQVSPPDLLIYLKASIPTLVDHIQQRGRDYEGTISIDYLKKLNDRYDQWISGYKAGKLLVINVDEVDFLNRPEDLGLIISNVQGELHGLF